ncbi:MAG: hypothetical protein JNK48_28615 [Bryobacterales bacterium]|nr:hypothetical protein [Bryobacterales bacterium]
MNPESLRQLWQSQEEQSQPMELEELRRKAAEFDARIRRRNWREYYAALFVAACCVGMLVARTPWHIRAGALLLLAGIALVCAHLYRKGSAEPLQHGATVSRDWYRKQLERQRDLLRGVWKWYLGPMTPGLAMWLAGGLWEHPERWGRSAISGGIAAAVFLAVGRLNAHAARKLDKELDSL